MPDPFSLALVLTLITACTSALYLGGDLSAALGYWGGRVQDGALLPANKGFWLLLKFGMQMCLILVTGHALASSRPVKAAIGRLAALPRSAHQAVALTAIVAMVCALVNWGLGLIVGALLAREVGRSTTARGLRVHYPVVGAAGYAGLLVWHGGLSGSAPLKVTQVQEMTKILGPGVEPIPLTETVFSPLNLVVTLTLMVVVPVVLCWMLPTKDEDIEVCTLEPQRPNVGNPARASTPAGRLDDSAVLAWLVAAMVAYYMWQYLSILGIDRIGPNGINLTFIALGLALHSSPRAYADAIADGTRGCAGIILQFPFYAGIMGMLSLSGLVSEFADIVSASVSATTLAPASFLSAGLVNLFVPSGGGQWALQGKVIVETAQTLNVPLGKAIMAFAYGDAWTNMLQPFWALPLLAITGIRASRLIGYTATLMLVVGPIIILCLVLL